MIIKEKLTFRCKLNYFEFVCRGIRPPKAQRCIGLFTFPATVSKDEEHAIFVPERRHN